MLSLCATSPNLTREAGQQRRAQILTSQPRVTHLVPAEFGPSGIVGGGERYAFELARHMAECVPTALVTFGATESERYVGALRIKTLAATWHVRGQRTNPLSKKMLHELLKADVVHCHQQRVMAASISALVCRLTGRRVVVSDLGGGGWDFSSYISTDRWFHAHLHISQYSRDVYGHSSKPWAHVIYGGVDTTKFTPDPSVHVEDMVLFVGRLLPHKGIDNLVDALPPELTLEIIGRPCDPAFLQLLHHKARCKRVVFRHDCNDDDLVNAYRRARCIVLPSVYRNSFGGVTKVPELLGQTLLEGLACGRPAICTDVASMPEIVKNEENGFVVPANHPAALREKLSWIFAHKNEANEMGAKGRQMVLQQFQWPTVVSRCLELYRA